MTHIVERKLNERLLKDPITLPMICYSTTYCKIKWDVIKISNDLQNGDGLHPIHAYSVKKMTKVCVKRGNVQIKPTAHDTNC
jgi:hypothetical protein